MASILNKISKDIKNNYSLILTLKNLVSLLRITFQKPEKLYEIAINYYECNKGQENVKKSIKYFTKAAILKHRDTQYHLGIIYSDDNIVK